VAHVKKSVSKPFSASPAVVVDDCAKRVQARTVPAGDDIFSGVNQLIDRAGRGGKFCGKILSGNRERSRRIVANEPKRLGARFFFFCGNGRGGGAFVVPVGVRRKTARERSRSDNGEQRGNVKHQIFLRHRFFSFSKIRVIIV